jgi:transposase
LSVLGRADWRSLEHRDHEPGDQALEVDPKKRTLGATERDECHRLMWHRILKNIDARRLVFIDEFGVNIRLARLFGWAPRGMRSRGSVPRNYGKNLSVCAALSLAGITAAMTIEGAVDGVAFEQYITKILAPTLQPRQLVILDNLAVHKQAAVRQAIEATGARVLFLPSYSPDFNPIEMIISAIKQRLRGVAATTREGLEAALPAALDAVTPHHARNCFRHCGYSVQ